MTKITKKEAHSRIESFLYNHIDMSDFWDDQAYYEDIQALAKVGYDKAKDALKEFHKRGIYEE